MIAVIQRVTRASVSIDSKIYSAIGQGLLILLGVGNEDNQQKVNWLVQKISQLRIFSDQEGKMNLSLMDTGGEALVVSQFTLLADAAKGNRPSYIRAARPEIAIPLYDLFCKEMSLKIGKSIKTGVFGADMQVELVNDGPVTIILDTEAL
jgi:D-tyrosyl-tRNA(Tyr) deacylase